MKYANIEDMSACFPYPVRPIVQGKRDDQIIHANREFIKANSRAIDTHLGGGTRGNMGLIISDEYYDMISPPTDAVPLLWTSPQAPGWAPTNTGGISARIRDARQISEEDVQT
jgi:hypothetical protein